MSSIRAARIGPTCIRRSAPVAVTARRSTCPRPCIQPVKRADDRDSAAHAIGQRREACIVEQRAPRTMASHLLVKPWAVKPPRRLGAPFGWERGEACAAGARCGHASARARIAEHRTERRGAAAAPQSDMGAARATSPNRCIAPPGGISPATVVAGAGLRQRSTASPSRPLGRVRSTRSSTSWPQPSGALIWPRDPAITRRSPRAQRYRAGGELFSAAASACAGGRNRRNIVGLRPPTDLLGAPGTAFAAGSPSSGSRGPLGGGVSRDHDRRLQPLGCTVTRTSSRDIHVALHLRFAGAQPATKPRSVGAVPLRSAARGIVEARRPLRHRAAHGSAPDLVGAEDAGRSRTGFPAAPGGVTIEPLPSRKVETWPCPQRGAQRALPSTPGLSCPGRPNNGL